MRRKVLAVPSTHMPQKDRKEARENGVGALWIAPFQASLSSEGENRVGPGPSI